jgi:transposase InsO family protein
MVRDGVAVPNGLASLVARVADGEKVNVSRECAALPVSRTQFYKYLKRFREEGVEGFFPRSRAPLTHPTETSVEVQDAIVAARKRLEGSGLDYGATSIGWHLEDHPQDWRVPGAPQWPLPSRATINRVLVDRGQIVPTPKRRPDKSRRFTRPARNDLWQMDGYDYKLADGAVVVVIEILDDHTRLNLACHAAVSENAADVWIAFILAVARYGLPREVLTDNGTAFNGKRRGWTSQLEAGAAALGVRAFPSSVAHPQTCGKVERGHGTGRKWLAKQPTARTVEELQDLLDRYREIYNNRRHQSLDGLTPNQAWVLAPVAGPAGHPLTLPLLVTTPTVSASGCIRIDSTEVGVGRTHGGKTATVFRTGDNVTVFIDGRHHHDRTIDRTRHYQPKTR